MFKRGFIGFVAGLWVLFVIGMLAVFVYFFSVAKGWVGYVPDMSEIADPEYKFASQIITSDGVEIGT
ncbi:MAG: hypothetical protein J6U62_04555, partial [Bacteroidaceae bacterium]|nr:hypothetical protein [Bacteroidaceae bacterium]